MKHLQIKQMVDRVLSAESTVEELVVFDEFYSNAGSYYNDEAIDQKVVDSNKEKIGRVPLQSKKQNWPLNLLLAITAVVIVSGIWTVLFNNPTSLPTDYINDIEPGGNKATLSLPNGKSIQLSDSKTGVIVGTSKLSYNDGTLIDNEASQNFSLSTPRGGTYQLHLPDGTNVWLNAGSTLNYIPPINEEGASRNVTLVGEAYFEVSKDINHPFVVTTEKQRITVLGTHFNVSAYSDELSTKTTLIEGSVSVAPLTTSGAEGTVMILKPNQEYTYTDTERASVKEVTTNEAISWKDGEFNFSGEALKSIMAKVARWYDVEVVYTDQADQQLLNKVFNGTVSKSSKVSQLLCLLESTGEVHFRVEGRRITVMR